MTRQSDKIAGVKSQATHYIEQEEAKEAESFGVNSGFFAASRRKLDFSGSAD